MSGPELEEDSGISFPVTLGLLLRSGNAKDIMAYFLDYVEIGEYTDLLAAYSYSITWFFSQSIYLYLVSWHDFYYYCEGLSQGIRGIYMPLFQTVLKKHFYLLHYLFAHLSTEYFIWIRFIWQLQSDFSTPTCSKSLTLGVLFFCYLFVGLFFSELCFSEQEWLMPC